MSYKFDVHYILQQQNIDNSLYIYSSVTTSATTETPATKTTVARVAVVVVSIVSLGIVVVVVAEANLFVCY